MHKIANVVVNVAYRRPGNVVVHVPVKFEVFEDKRCFKAVPFITREVKRLIQLPKVLSFTVKNSRIYTLDKKEVIEEIVDELVKLEVVEMQEKRIYKTQILERASCS